MAIKAPGSPDDVRDLLPRLGSAARLDPEFLYATWRVKMWVAGYGTYQDIDAAVSRGDLIPGQDPP